MKLPEWIQPGLIGGVVGAIAISILGFTWGGWTLGSTAKAMAEDQSQLAVAEAVAPYCERNARDDPQFNAILVEISEARGDYAKRNLVNDAGWIDGQDADSSSRDRNRALEDACVRLLEETEQEVAQASD